MSFPEWGYSYNALYVPLRQWGWQCALMPAGEVEEEGGFNGSLSFEEREKKRKERKRQIEQDKDDFHRLFRVDIDPRDASSSFEFRHYANFIRDTLRVSSGDFRDRDGIARVLRNAVRDGRIIPVISRAWHGGQRMFKHCAPLHWPRDGGGVSFATGAGASNASTGRFTGPFAAAMHAADTVMDSRLASTSRVFSGTGSSGSGSGGFDWRGAAESVAGALFGGEDSTDDSRSDSMLKSFGDSDDDGSLLGDAQPFEYQQDMPDGDVFDLAKTPNDGEPGTWYTNSGSGQMRLYGSDGQPVVDLDFDHDHGQGIPHAHNWSINPLTGKNGRGSGVPFSILP